MTGKTGLQPLLSGLAISPVRMFPFCEFLAFIHMTVVDVIIAQGKSNIKRQRAKENAARNAASLWIEIVQRPRS